jgi:hypothetical protein
VKPKGKASDGLGLLIGLGIPKKGKGPMPGDEGDDAHEEKQLAARAFLKAIRRDDEDALIDAFTQLSECCGGGMSKDSDDDKSETEDEDDDY